MGRRRKKNLQLPRRMHEGNGYYYYVSYSNGKRKWTPLGNDLALAHLKWAELENIEVGKTENVTFTIVAARYQRGIIPTKDNKTQ